MNNKPKLYSYIVSGYMNDETKDKFVTIVKDCLNAYQASLYVLAVYGDSVIIDYDSIIRILE